MILQLLVASALPVGAPPSSYGARADPPAASAAHEATAVVQCTVTAQGALSACALVSAPSDRLGAAAMRATRTLHVKPVMRDGRPADAMVTFPITFRVTDDATPPSIIAPAPQP